MTDATKPGAAWGTPEEREGFRRAYEELERIVDSKDLEPYDVVEAVERQRRAWQPAKTRTVLLAESHVWTAISECRSMTWQEGLASIASEDHRRIDSLPDEFVRLVYCLGYGEHESVTLEDRAPPKSGTPQFWKLFWACCHPVKEARDFAPILKGGCRNARSRLQNKMDLLVALKKSGIWLMDASIVGLYESGNKYKRKKQMNQIIRHTWEEYTKTVLKSLAPKAVIVIGMRVWDLLQPLLDPAGREIGFTADRIPQPQARNVKANEWAAHYALLNATCRIGN